MIASRTFNEREGGHINTAYGIVTTGSIWKFLKLKDKVYIDVEEYHIRQPEKIMGILLEIISSEKMSSGEDG